MYTPLKKAAVILTIIALLTISSGSTLFAWEDNQIEPPDAMSMLSDFVAVRPVGIVSLATGFVVFIASSPFSALGGNIGTAWDKLVAEPAEYTFRRPLGCF